MAKTKYATDSDEQEITRILAIMKPRLDILRDTDFHGNHWGNAKEAITFLVVNGHDRVAHELARRFASDRPAFVDDRALGGQAAQSNWSNRVTPGDAVKAIRALNTATRPGLRGLDCAGGSCAAAFRGGMRGLGAGDVRQQAEQHLRARWDHPGRKGWQGSMTFAQYRSANLSSVIRNIRDGRLPDGRGGYKD